MIERRRWDLNPCDAINVLLPFQGSPFSLLGTSPCTDCGASFNTRASSRDTRCRPGHAGHIFLAVLKTKVLTHQCGNLPASALRGECGIRTHGPLRDHWFSRPAPSTTRPTLLLKHVPSAKAETAPCRGL